eukprot:SAG31_NODE_8010_length_1542_cov_1.155925_3_plen_145_part_01
MLFTFITVSALGAIITGIICDSFGALRDEKDTAQTYRKQTNFVTGISFHEIAEQDQPSTVNYLYLLLHLQQKEYRNRSVPGQLHPSDVDSWELDRLSAIEATVLDQIQAGDNSWMPRDTCLFKENVRTEHQKLLDKINGIESGLT